MASFLCLHFQLFLTDVAHSSDVFIVEIEQVIKLMPAV